jgi:hypothetical protein
VKVTIGLRDEDMAKFQSGNEKWGLFDKTEGLIQIATEIGLEYLERIDFDVAGAIRADVRKRIGGAK